MDSKSVISPILYYRMLAYAFEYFGETFSNALYLDNFFYFKAEICGK